MSAHMKKHLTKIEIDGKKFEIPKKEAGAILSLVESLEQKAKSVQPENVFKDMVKKRPKFAINLRGARFKENMSQRELSEKTGIPVTTISKYENGEREISEEQAEKLSKVLRVNNKLFLC